MQTIEKEELRKLYITDKLSDQKIADSIGIKRRDVTRLRHLYKISAIEDYERFENTELSLREKEILIGLMLGDGHMRKRGKTKSYPELMIEQSVKHREYIEWIRKELNGWVYDKNKPLKENTKYSKVTDSFNKSLSFCTTPHPVFSEFFNAFYVDGKKIVNFEILEKYFSTISLAVWIMDDGGLAGHNKRSRLCTNGFSKEEVEQISQFLLNKYGLKAWVSIARTKNRETWELHFDKASTLKITELIKDIVVPSMQYKLFRSN